MLHIIWITALAAITACLSVDPPKEEVRALIEPALKVIELRKRYTIIVPVYYYPDWTAVTTCGIIPTAIGQYIALLNRSVQLICYLASQNGLYETNAAAVATPYPVTCDCLCARSGNYLGCVDQSIGSVATTCTDYTTSPNYCDSDQPCYWDLHW